MLSLVCCHLQQLQSAVICLLCSVCLFSILKDVC